MVDRASPIQQRKALEVANNFIKAGIGFVPMPVTNAIEFDALMNQAIDKLVRLKNEAEEAEQRQQG